jgi:hypothetical protein
VLENAQEVIRVIPGRAASGTDPSSAKATCATYSQKSTSLPKATDRVTVEIVNPDSIDAHNYTVGFAPLPAPFRFPSGDSATIGWHLVDATTGDTLLRNRANRARERGFRRGARHEGAGAGLPAPGARPRRRRVPVSCRNRSGHSKATSHCRARRSVAG